MGHIPCSLCTSFNFIKKIFIQLLLLNKTSKHALVLDSLISSKLHSKNPNAVKKGVLCFRQLCLYQVVLSIPPVNFPQKQQVFPLGTFFFPQEIIVNSGHQKLKICNFPGILHYNFFIHCIYSQEKCEFSITSPDKYSIYYYCICLY